MFKSSTLLPLLLIVVGTTLPGPVRADENYSGRWFVSITGQPFIMDLSQDGTVIRGTMVPQSKNKRHIAVVTGSHHGKTIELTSNNRDLSVVYNFHGGLIGKGASQALVGDYSRNNRHFNSWYGVRYENRSYYGSPDTGYSTFHSADETQPPPF